MPEQDEVISRARVVKAKYEGDLMTRPGVTGVGVGLRQRSGELTDEVCIVVMVHTKYLPDDLAPDQILPTELDGIPVDVQQTGDIMAE